MIKYIKNALDTSRDLEKLISDVNESAQCTVDSLKGNGYIIDELCYDKEGKPHLKSIHKY